MLKDFDKHPRMDSEEIKDRLQTDFISRLPDCRKDDSLAEDFLKEIRKIHRKLKGLLNSRFASAKHLLRRVFGPTKWG